jgi:hypothetical protein
VGAGVHEFLILVPDEEAIIISGRCITEEKAPTLLFFKSRARESCIKINNIQNTPH